MYSTTVFMYRRSMRTFHSIQAARIGINIIHAKTHLNIISSRTLFIEYFHNFTSALATGYLYTTCTKGQVWLLDALLCLVRLFHLFHSHSTFLLQYPSSINLRVSKSVEQHLYFYSPLQSWYPCFVLQKLLLLLLSIAFPR